MQTDLAEEIKESEVGKEADAILRKCVHCGFCTATCPTYQHLGDELDGPRGRIYLIKQMLEGNEVTAKTQKHLDRCLVCRSCETTCPSGVQYGKLIEIGRDYVNKKVDRPFQEQLTRKVLRTIVPYPSRMQPLLKLGQTVKPLLPATLKAMLPIQQANNPWPTQNHQRQMLVLAGCAQSTIKPGTNEAAAKIFDKLNIKLITAPEAGCCGAVSYHMTEHDEGKNFMRRNIDAWWPYIEKGCEAILINASGCGAMVKEYGEILKKDIEYAAKAEKVSQIAKDPCEILAHENYLSLDIKKNIKTADQKIAFQTPCSLQHAQGLNGAVEKVLTQLGFKLSAVANSHLCCGSAGTYSIFQKEIAHKLRDNKLDALMADQPDVIATANIGCQLHLESKASIPVKHWLEIIAERL